MEFRQDSWRRKTRVPGLSYAILYVILVVAIFVQLRLLTSVVTVIAADIATAVDSFHRITTATTVAIDVFNGGCSVGTPNNQHCCCSQPHGQQRMSVGRDAISGCSWAGHVPVDFQTGREVDYSTFPSVRYSIVQISAAASLLPFPSVIVPLAIRVSESSGEAASLL